MGVTIDKLLGEALMHEHVVGDIDASGTPSASTYLRGDGSWSTPTGSGGATVIVGEYDFVQTNYPSAESEQYVYKLGGSSGSVVTTVTINFTDSSKQVFESYTIS